MTVLLFKSPKGLTYEVVLEWDARREQWHWVGLEFDFWAYPIAGDHPADDLNAPTAFFQAEVSRTGDYSGRSVPLTITCPPSGEVTEDIFASKCLKELGRFWDLFGEFEDAE